ncbi:unnamed protein product [Miscanthus lutarioriparius]|uniref:Uncharacterized protein n=1 Tax=Miscanthus lutarioriparius TaxID=422564 RepID=A0A811NQF8_9POAL|nr:unnamed protein product [Miscanthus lutarioriparius]
MAAAGSSARVRRTRTGELPLVSGEGEAEAEVAAGVGEVNRYGRKAGRSLASWERPRPVFPARLAKGL